MKRRWLTSAALLALAAAATLGLAACGGDDNEAADTSGGGGGGSSDITEVIKQLGGPVTYGTVAKGGTYRIANTDFAQSDGFDPTGEYFGSAWTIYNNLLLRTLVSYDYTAGPAGNELRADLATEIPEPSADGLTYTFTLKDGVTFGPPVNRPITSKDIAYAFERIATPERRRPVRRLLPADQGPPRVQRREGQDHLGHHDARRQDDHLHADQARRRLPLPRSRCRPPRRSPRRWPSATPRPPSTAATSSRAART